jgi:hypothetical protein
VATGVIIPNAGLAILTNRIVGAGTEPKYIGIGTGTATPAAGDTGLQTPRSESRVSGTSSRVQTTVANDTYQVVGEITCAWTPAAVTEVGLFDAPTGGNCFLHGVHDVVNLAVGDKIEYTVRAVFARPAEEV